MLDKSLIWKVFGHVEFHIECIECIVHQYYVFCERFLCFSWEQADTWYIKLSMSSLSFLHTDTTNNLLAVQVEGVSSPNNATINCTFLSGFTGSARCTVQYGTDPTYMKLPYSAESTETGTAGDSVFVVLKDQFNPSTVYYYTVSTVSGDVTVTVQATFTTPQYSMHDVHM